MTARVERDENAERVRDHPDARDANDRKTLAEEEAFEDQHPGASADARRRQTDRNASHRDPDTGEKKIGSALPREEGRRS